MSKWENFEEKMKSKRAEKYLKEHLSDFPLLGGYVNVYYARKAVEIAKEEMAEEAVTAYISICDHNISEGRCVLGGECDAANCPYCKEFKQKMMEIQNK